MTPHVLALEGPHGAGKSRHTDALAAALRARGVDARAFHHPAPPRGAGPVEAALFFAAEREGLVRRTRTAVIVADRWYHSTAVLASALRLSDYTTAHALQRVAEVEVERYRNARHYDLAPVHLDAPDDVLDGRLAKRGAPPTALEHAERAQLRHARAQAVRPPRGVDTSRAREVVEAELLAWAVDVLGIGTSRGVPRPTQQGGV